MGRLSGFAKFSWFVLVYNFFIILWGAYVRASGSGAGCGAHWPLCNGMVIPRDAQLETIIEFTHRVTSGITLVLVAVMFVWARRVYSKNHLIRKSTTWAMVFIILEALIGAGLVLFQWTAENESMARAYAMMAHLVNTFLLIGSIGLTGWWSSTSIPERLSANGVYGALLIIGLTAVCILGASGAVTALGDTLFPASSLAEGLAQDFSPTAHILLRLRVFHPMIAAATGMYLGAVAFWLRRKYPINRVVLFCNVLMGLFLLQLVLGVFNVALMAPIWMQLVHLLVSQILWLSLVILSAVIFGTANLLPGTVNEVRH